MLQSVLISKNAKQYSDSDTLKTDDDIDDDEIEKKRKIISNSTLKTAFKQQEVSLFQKMKVLYKKYTGIIWIAIGILVLFGVGDKIYYHINPTAAVKDYYLTQIVTGKDTCTVGEFADQVGGTFTVTKLDNGTYNILLKYVSDYDTTFMFVVDPSDDNAVTVIYAYENPVNGGSAYKSDDSQECMQMLY